MAKILKLAGCPKVTTNNIYSSRHWTQRDAVKNKFRRWFMGLNHKLIPHYTECVNLSFIFSFRIRPLDSSNCSYMGKMIEDLLVTYGKLEKDTVGFVGAVSYRSIKDAAQKEDVVVYLKISQDTKALFITEGD